MKLHGAVIIEQDVRFSIFSVKSNVTQYTAHATAFRQNIATFFPNMPIILLSFDAQKRPHYYGRKDIVAFLKTIDVHDIPWKEYHIY